jgi:phosphopantothenoylcysteine decarboxylase/phosphopantothenate--cysteine ligase
VTGSIAAYKAVEVARLLIKERVKVLPLMTHSAARFVGPVTLAGICGEPVATDMWDPSYPGEAHVAIAAKADMIAIVPATADMLARLAHGRADDLVTATALCARGPVLVAPAMHPRMWNHPATQANLAELGAQGRVRMIGPVDGPVASGESGMGRMAEPADIVRKILSILSPFRLDLGARRIVVTAGPTHEAIDPVRYVGNRSSGKMGFAIAACAAARGAQVHLIAGPVSLETPSGVMRTDVESAAEMQKAVEDALKDADALVMAAAVADYRPASAAAAKIKKDGAAPPAIALTENPDIIATIGEKRNGAKKPLLVAFALETGDDAQVIAYAKKKLAAKKVDLVVANAAHESLGKDENRVAFVSTDGEEPFVNASKDALADLILDRVLSRLAG